MNTNHHAIAPLRVLLLGVLSALVALQLFLLYAGVMNLDALDGKPYGWWLVAVLASLIVPAEIVFVATWQLLGLVRDGRIFSDAAFGWVDTIVWAMGGGWALLVGVLAYVTYHADDPGMPVVIFAVTIAAGAVGLVTVVMRSLLRRAARLRTDMDAVI